MHSFLNTETFKEAQRMAPWATTFRKFEDGYMAFLDKKTRNYWKKNLIQFYKK